MEFVAAKCPSCGGELRLPDDMKIAECLHCGQDVIVREAINSIGVNIENLRKLADEAFQLRNFYEANSYYSKILEHDDSNITDRLKKFIASGDNETVEKSLVIAKINSILETLPEDESESLRIKIADWLWHLVGGIEPDRNDDRFLYFYNQVLEFNSNHLECLRQKVRKSRELLEDDYRFIKARNPYDKENKSTIFEYLESYRRRRNIVEVADRRLKRVDPYYIPKPLEDEPVLTPKVNNSGSTSKITNSGCASLTLFILVTIIIATFTLNIVFLLF